MKDTNVIYSTVTCNALDREDERRSLRGMGYELQSSHPLPAGYTVYLYARRARTGGICDYTALIVRPLGDIELRSLETHGPR